MKRNRYTESIEFYSAQHASNVVRYTAPRKYTVSIKHSNKYEIHRVCASGGGGGDIWPTASLLSL